jgi:hypothetical protein
MPVFRLRHWAVTGVLSALTLFAIILPGCGGTTETVGAVGEGKARLKRFEDPKTIPKTGPAGKAVAKVPPRGVRGGGPN